MKLVDYNIMFIQIKGKNNEPVENPKTQTISNTQGHVMEICVTNMHTTSTTMLCTEKKL